MHELSLYFAPGACSRVPLIALEQLNHPFTTKLITFMKGEHKAQAFTRLNSSGKIPVLMVDGNPISQNVAILMWLAQTYPQANLLPKSDSLMSQTRHLSALLRFTADLHPLVTRIRIPQFFCDLEGAPSRVVELATEGMAFQLQSLENDLAMQTWVLGQEWSILDAYLHWVWFRITGAGFDSSMFPNIAAHYSRTLQIPAVQRAIAREAEAEKWLESQGMMPRF